ncbi:MAG: transposase [Anaerolineae bacterium]|nr:transposase [Anaerolineae bacterium]
MTVRLTERQSVYQQLSQLIKTDPRRVAVLADLVIAIPLSRSLQSQDLAANIIRDIQDQSIVQMLRRFYKNEAVTWATIYWPLLEQFLAQLDMAAYYLLMDTTEIGQGHRALVLSLAYQHRSVPLIWQVEAGAKGHTTEQAQVELLKQLGRHFQPDRPVIFLGDSEFDGIKLQQYLTEQGWYYVCRTSPTLYVYPVGQADGFPLADLVPEPDCPEHYLDQVEFTTKHRYGPLACWLFASVNLSTPLLD